MKNCVRQFILVVLLFAATSAKSQSVKELFSNSGIWADYSDVVPGKNSPEVKGRLANINWSNIETEPNVWDWTKFDDDIAKRVADSLPVIFMVYTRMNAPLWLFSNGVPMVNETSESGVNIGYSPYYLDEDYDFYFKRMITKVRDHVQALEPALRNKIIGVQACFGSTGDQIAYKGNVPAQYQITDAQFDSLFKVYSLFYYNAYKDLRPRIKMLSNPNYQGPEEHYWLIDNCPGGWTKCGTMGKGFQLNMELDKRDWLYDLLNKPWAGSYIRSRSEIWGDQLDAGWWIKGEYKNMFALMCYCIYWGLDWPNERYDLLMDKKHDSAFKFFDKYAGQKVPAVATNAMCALKDVLDASDETRFPEAAYGPIDRFSKSRYISIYNSFANYGAKLEDQAAMTGSEYDCLYAKGTNDVGWHLLPGNYERYLRQIDANLTSAGYWNVNPENNDAMYGRFARGFDLAEGKDALCFDLEDAFLRSAPLDGEYPVTIEVTYYDDGNGSWQLYYDAQSNSDKASVIVTCGNTKTWKKRTIVLGDAYFGNRGVRGSDFYIKSTGGSNVIFSVVELSRPEQSAVGFLTSPLPAFDTVCIGSEENIKSFVLNAAYLDGTDVQVGPLEGYTFSRASNGVFTKSLTYDSNRNQINSTIYVKINTSDSGVFNGNIPITGGGVKLVFVKAKGSVLNTSPVLNAYVTKISCYNANDAAINLQPTGGIGPFTYDWTNSVQPYWNETIQDIEGLKEANYTVVVKSFAGCSTTKTFKITQPDKLTEPAGIDGPSSVEKLQSGVKFSVKDPVDGYEYIWTVPGIASITSGQSTPSITVDWGKADGNVKVQAQTDCGISIGALKFVTAVDPVEAGISSSMEATAETDKLVSRPMIVMPNPAKDIATLQFYAESSFAYSVQIADIRGKILLAKKGTAAPGTNIEKLDVHKFGNGYYFITLINNKGEKHTFKLLKD